MKKTILYAIAAAVITAIAAITIVGCDGDFGEGSAKVNAYLDKFHHITKRFNVTYDGNGSTGGSAPKDNYSPYDSGGTVTSLSNTFEKTGFKFTGWNTSADGTGKAYEAGNTFKIYENVTLYAQWEDQSKFLYTVIVNTYPITGTGASGGGSYAMGRTINIDAGTYADWQFQNWTVTSGNVTLADANESATTFIMPENDVIVTANFVFSSGSVDTSSFTDSRDGKTYRKVTIGEQTWMAQNLNYDVIDNSWCYNNSVDNCNKYGRLYTWNAATTACPAGWKLPDTADWNRLVTAVGGSMAGTKLTAKSGWDYNGGGTDDYGFSALPGGYRNSDGSFGNAGNIGNWWTAAEYDDGDRAYHRFTKGRGDGVTGGYSGKSEAFSARCVEDL